MASILYRRFDQHAEDPEPLFRLYDAVHGDSTPLRQRWSWEFLRHPERLGTQVFVAEVLGELVGMTARLPCTLSIGGELERANFATNSMVRPDYRRLRIIRELYALAASSGEIQLSRGTLPVMHAVLLKMGYHDVAPRAAQVAIVSPVSWVISKMVGTGLSRVREGIGDVELGEFVRLNRIEGEFDCLDRPPSGASRDGIVKDGRVLNWRYVENPIRRYEVLARRGRGEPLSLLVIGFNGATAYLVDLRWAEHAPDEPAATIRFAKTLARQMGAVQLVFWGNLPALRHEMRNQGFRARRGSIPFSVFSRDGRHRSMKWEELHVVHGDGDLEYL